VPRTKRHSATRRREAAAHSDIDPSEALNEAIAAAREGRYEDALARHLWIQDHSLKKCPSFSGVRSSFALSAWIELGKKFPRALKELKRVRDRAVQRVRNRRDVWRNFCDFTSFNRYLDDRARTIHEFRRMADRDPESAELVYFAVEEELYAAGEYKLCGLFVKPEEFGAIQRGFKVNLNLAKEPGIGANHAKWARKYFGERARRMERLLMLNGRAKEARVVARKAARLFKNKG
jgi:hypothetical protein